MEARSSGRTQAEKRGQRVWWPQEGEQTGGCPLVAGVRRPGSSVTYLLTVKDQCPPKPSPHLLAPHHPGLLLGCLLPRNMPFKAPSPLNPSPPCPPSMRPLSPSADPDSTQSLGDPEPYLLLPPLGLQSLLITYLH